MHFCYFFTNHNILCFTFMSTTLFSKNSRKYFIYANLTPFLPKKNRATAPGPTCDPVTGS